MADDDIRKSLGVLTVRTAMATEYDENRRNAVEKADERMDKNSQNIHNTGDACSPTGGG